MKIDKSTGEKIVVKMDHEMAELIPAFLENWNTGIKLLIDALSIIRRL